MYRSEINIEIANNVLVSSINYQNVSQISDHSESEINQMLTIG